jgi:uncharacterized delta-60 repeat protein
MDKYEKKFLLLYMFTFIYNVKSVHSLTLTSNLKKIMKTYNLLFVFIFCLAINLNAQSLLNDGSLDTTFGNNGTISYSAQTATQLTDIIQQQDGKILVLGNKGSSGYGKPFIARYNLDGSIDNSFIESTPIINFTSVYSQNAVIQADGKILVLSKTFPFNVETYGSPLCLIRYLSNGLIDTTFGQNGVLMTDLTLPDEVNTKISPTKVLLQSDGKIVVVGDKKYQPFDNSKIQKKAAFVARFEANGDIDYSFGNSGQVRIALQKETYLTGGGVIQPDRKLVVYGSTNNTNGFNFPFVQRYNYDGNLDNTFANGIIPNQFMVIPSSKSILLLPDGRILLLSYQGIRRLNFNGLLDNSFLIKSFVYNNQEALRASDFAVQNDGKILVGGNFYLAKICGGIGRLLPNGEIDTSFGNNGFFIKDGSKKDFYYPRILLQNDGNIILGGSPNQVSGYTLSRYTGTPISLENNKFTSPNH